MTARPFLAALVLAAVPVASTPLRAAERGDAFKQARATCAAFDLDPCIARSRALLQQKDLSTAERVAVLEQLGSALAVLGDPVGAERAFAELLDLAPAHDLPADTPPKILTVWRSTRADHAARAAAAAQAALEELRGKVRVASSVADAHTGGTPFTVAVDVEAPAGSVVRVLVHHRREGATGFTSQPAEAQPNGTTWTLVVPAALLNAPDGGALAWHAEVLDAQGQVLGRLASAEAPRMVTLSPGVEAPPAAPAQRVGEPAKGVTGALLATGVTGALIGVLGLPLVALLVTVVPPLLPLAPVATAAAGAVAAVSGWVAFQRAGRFRAPLLPALLAGSLAPLGGCLAGAPCLVCAGGVLANQLGPEDVHPATALGNAGYNYALIALVTLPTVLLGGCGALLAGATSPALVAGLLWATGREMVEGEPEFVPDLVRATPRAQPLEEEQP